MQDADDDRGDSGSSAGARWDDLLASHRRRWIATVLGDREVIDLDHHEHPAEAIEQASPDAAIVSMQGLAAGAGSALRDQLRSAVARGTAVVIGIPVDDGTQADAEELRRELGRATLVTQLLGAGSLIRPEAASDSAVHVLVCSNLEASITNGAGTDVDVTAVPLVSGYVAHLERANRALRDANVRLARERLGMHDSAAAAVAERRMRLAERVEDLETALETEKQVAFRNHELFLWARQALRAPRYRAVDKVRDLLFSIPGVRFVLESRRRRLAATGEWMESDSDRQNAGTPR